MPDKLPDRDCLAYISLATFPTKEKKRRRRKEEFFFFFFAVQKKRRPNS
jgi:hypothetical protein